MKTEKEIIDILNSRIRFSNNYINSFNDYILMNPISTYLKNQCVYNQLLSSKDVDFLIDSVDLTNENQDSFGKLTIDYLFENKNYLNENQILNILKKSNLNNFLVTLKVGDYLNNNDVSNKIKDYICKNIYLDDCINYDLLFENLTQSQINIINNRRKNI